MKKTLSILFFLSVYVFLLPARAQNTSLPDRAKNQKADTSKTFQPMEAEASYPGGNNNFNRYILYKIKANNTTTYNGVVSVHFVVDSDGKIRTAEITKSAAPDDFNQQVLKIFLNSPRWKPAMQNGRTVKENLDISIQF